MSLIFQLASVCLLSVVCQAYKGGAPPGICDSMVPQHGVDPQPLPSPYTLTIDKSSVRVGENITISIAVKNQNDSFKGFFLQARDDKGNILGKFAKVPDTKHVNCKSGTKNALTHNSDSDKKKITTYWNIPQASRYPIHFRLTIARNGGEFWVGQTSEKVTIVGNTTQRKAA